MNRRQRELLVTSVSLLALAWQCACSSPQVGKIAEALSYYVIEQEQDIDAWLKQYALQAKPAHPAVIVEGASPWV